MYLNIGPMRWFLTIVLTIFFSPSSNAEIFDLKATVSTSTNVVTIKILGAHLTDSLLEKEGDSPGIFFEAVVLDSFSGLTTPHEKVLILGNLPLKVGFDYLVFLETKKLTASWKMFWDPILTGTDSDIHTFFGFPSRSTSRSE